MRAVLLLLSGVGLVACGGTAFTAASDGLDGGSVDSSSPADSPDARPMAIGDEGGQDVTADGPGAVACAGTCVALPSGWSVVESAFGTDPGGAVCGLGYSGGRTVLHDGLSASAATCACSCGAPSGGTCQIGLSCTTTACGSWTNTTYVQAGHCTAVSSLCSPPLALGSSGGVPSAPGSCGSHPQTTVPQSTWSGTATTCAPTASAVCAAGACAPIADVGFKQCVEATGDVACPAGWPDRHVEYANLNDSRGCSTCTCGQPSGATCVGQVLSYGAASCTGSAQGSFAPSSQCVSVAFTSIDYEATPSGGSCVASSVSPVGTATPNGPVTVCCL